MVRVLRGRFEETSPNDSGEYGPLLVVQYYLRVEEAALFRVSSTYWTIVCLPAKTACVVGTELVNQGNQSATRNLWES